MTKVHCIGDEFSMIYVKHTGSAWELIWRDGRGDWHSLGKHHFLTDAKRDARALLRG